MVPDATTCKILGGMLIAVAGTTGAYFLLRSETLPNFIEEVDETIEDKFNDLNIENCSLKSNENEKTCTNLNTEKLKTIFKAFSNKGKNLIIDGGNNVTLKIKRNETDKTIFNNGWKFTFETTTDVTIKSETNDQNPITLKANTNPEFKINNSNNFEKAWNISKLASRVNLTCTNNGSTKTCNLPSGKTINVLKTNGSYVKGTSFTGNLTFERDKNNHNQGFKFTTSQEITLTGGTDTSLTSEHKKLKADESYEIKLQTIGSTQAWFLSKVSNS